jgi:hypothetical protein
MSTPEGISVFRDHRVVELVGHADPQHVVGDPRAAGAGERAAGDGARLLGSFQRRTSREEVRAGSIASKSHCSHEQPLDPAQLWSLQGM